VILAGRRILLGPLIGTALLLVQKNFLSLGAYGDKLMLGAVLVAVLCLCPRGLASLWPQRAAPEGVAPGVRPARS